MADQNLPNLLKICENYSKDSCFVYKMCTDCNRKNGFVILKKFDKTLKNENRKVINSKYAKYRASHLEVIMILDPDNLSKTIDELLHIYHKKTKKYYGEPLTTIM